MEVLVDTSVWSLALRRSKRTSKDEIIAESFSELIREGRVKMIGPIRQELLSGISDETQFQKLKKQLNAFEDLPIHTENYERAAEMSNECRKKGICGSHVDFLICSIAEFYHLSIFTTDKDFSFYTKHLPIRLYNET